MQISSINGLPNFGYKLSTNFMTAIENECYLYNISKLNKSKFAERERFYDLISEIELNGPSKVLDVNEQGAIVLDNKKLGDTYYDYRIGKCISFKTLQEVYKKLFHKRSVKNK